jgi:hypothetical protein
MTVTTPQKVIVIIAGIIIGALVLDLLLGISLGTFLYHADAEATGGDCGR